MARKRYISTDMSKSGKLEELARRAGDYGVLLFTWMIPHLDDWGRMEGEPDKVFYEVTPRFMPLGKTPSDAEAALTAMHELGLINWYEVGGIRYIQANLDTFYELQTYIPKDKRATDKSQYPPPPNSEAAQANTESRRVAQSSTGSREVAQNTPSPSPTPTSTLSLNDFVSATGDTNPSHYEVIASFVDDGINIELVKEALQKARGRRIPWSYAKSILSSWLKQGIKTVDDLAKSEESDRASPVITDEAIAESRKALDDEIMEKVVRREHAAAEAKYQERVAQLRPRKSGAGSRASPS